MQGSLSMNGVVENEIKSLEGEALKNVAYLLNRVPTKAKVSCYFIGDS